MFKKTLLCAAVTVVASAVSLSSAVAAEYPTKPIKMVVAFGAGGSTDTMARIFAKYAEKYIGKRIIVINKTGAGGELGWTFLSRAKPDGYTIGLINSPGVEIYPFTRAETIQYNLEDIRPLVNVVTDPGVLAVSADSPYKTLNDFVAHIKANPGKVTVSHEGVGGDDHLAALTFGKKANVDMNFVAFNGNAEATAALLGGHIDAFEGNMSEAAAQIKSGAVRALAVWAPERVSAIPDVQTGREQGMDIISAASRGIAVPAGVPDDIYQKLMETAKKVVSDEGFRAELAKLNMPVNPMYGKDYEQFMQTTHDTLKSIWDVEPWIVK
ncbi:MAG: tripartite tricarboxylate transporter substrate binding protein [Amphritea sp.]|nr:tripartite tricarboxylate transporter substrate binding protein [Amphritea sp.]